MGRVAGSCTQRSMTNRWGVAELAKRRTVNPEIAGSTPAAPVLVCWRGARAAQGSGLLNRDARKASVGSNPTLSVVSGLRNARLPGPCSVQVLDGCPSGLRSTIGNRVG
jgi:hypothetical protein